MTDNEDNGENEEPVTPANPLIVAEQLAEELKGFDVMASRKEVLEILKDRFVASTMETASQKQLAESMLVEKLIEKISTENLNPNMLLRILEGISKSNEGSIESILGGKGNANPGKGILDVTINNNPQQGGSTVNSTARRVEEGEEVQHPMKDANTLLEAMNIIAKSVTNNKNLIKRDDEDIIDVDVEDDK